ncbi:putative spermidine/putrescine transport system ATP-binding protein [Rhodoglobus vestalii]|uniref:ABC-type quaternary amine transporter n=1 Tax=Rhodoglobus vestalii TaxID=193384 RepID=A0A8H2PWK2_9MICO|nr:ABC transporter ATP-binding protein [Rhodoglobus vestalii]TQO19270.1 putative spermidine/putrescine transport system ATP-binding protein [Rhodoglobus vestalii]
MTTTLTDSRATSAPVTGATVQLSAVVKAFAGHTALNSIDLNVAPGELVALLGPSGCGKTTALRSISGLESIDGGRILIDDEDVADIPTNKRDIGMVFQAYSLFPHMSVLENVEFGLKMRKVPAARRRERALETLDMVGLTKHRDRFAHQLSGGQQQRVALARALVTRPRVLLLDEPLSALDAKVRVQLREEIRRIQTELGITTVFVTHDQEEALAVADRVAVMRDGRIEQIGTPEELYATPSSAFVADFVGLSNRMPADLIDGTVMLHGWRLNLLGDPMPDGPVVALVRPEDMVLATDGIAGVVIASSFLGSLRRTRVRLSDSTVVAVQHEVERHPLPGESVSVRLKGAPVSALPLNPTK